MMNNMINYNIPYINRWYIEIYYISILNSQDIYQSWHENELPCDYENENNSQALKIFYSLWGLPLVVNYGRTYDEIHDVTGPIVVDQTTDYELLPKFYEGITTVWNPTKLKSVLSYPSEDRSYEDDKVEVWTRQFLRDLENHKQLNTHKLVGRYID